jgi:hypothetical protein
MTGPSSPFLSNRPQWPALHPAVYKLLIGSVAAMFLAVWVFFSHGAYTAFQLVVVAAFLVMFVGVPWVLARLAQAPTRSNEPSFGEWRAGDLSIHTGPIPAGEAALMILIAPAAVVIGIAAISAIAYLAAIGAI